MNADGKPVQRTIRQMTAGELTAAVRWNGEESERLNQEAAPFTVLMEARERGEHPPLPPKDECRRGVALLREASEAHERVARLLTLAATAMPHGTTIPA